ncbi:protein of unknown function [Shewanella benthica]|uniref:Uncharacterized protein n=1 Tax=Shewanella benthica TaxID=43661 RepID=A0A330M0S6_9GAMM|nr:protein of unknown function [Shewanella benthica]
MPHCHQHKPVLLVVAFDYAVGNKCESVVWVWGLTMIQVYLNDHHNYLFLPLP